MAPAPAIITIDGPASSGKSTLGQKLAVELGYLYFDTGCLYRAVTVAALQRGIPLTDAAAMAGLTAALDIRVQPPNVKDGRQYTVLVDDMDVTWELRAPQTDASVSVVSTFPEVRRTLTDCMRTIARSGSVVMVGRDIGTVVLPDAPLKIYLDANVHERARRRHAEIIARGEQSDYDEVLEAMHIRDRTDSARKAAPLRAAPDAHVLVTTGMEPEQALAEIKSIVRQHST